MWKIEGGGIVLAGINSPSFLCLSRNKTLSPPLPAQLKSNEHSTSVQWDDFRSSVNFNIQESLIHGICAEMSIAGFFQGLGVLD
jgi:hypothetical protein